MLDLVREEERIATLTGLGFEELLSALDQESQGVLVERYSELADRYLILCGRGQRSPAEQLELDRIESSLASVLGKRGLLVLGGRLLGLLIPARSCSALLLDERASRRCWQELAMTLGSLVQRALSLPCPVPVDTAGLTEDAERAREAVASLGALAPTGSLCGFFGRRRRADAGMLRLLDTLGRHRASAEAWSAAAMLFDPVRVTPRQRLQRLDWCHRLAALANCHRLEITAAAQFQKVADLVRAGLEA